MSGPVATSTDALRLASEQPPDAALIDFDLRDGERADGLIQLLHVLGPCRRRDGLHAASDRQPSRHHYPAQTAEFGGAAWQLASNNRAQAAR